MLSYAFPPAAVPEAFLSAKRLGNVPNLTVDVIALEPGPGLRVDRSLDDYVATRFGRVVRLRVPDLLRRLGAGKIGATVQIPGLYHIVNRMALRAATQLDPVGYDAVLTWSQWHAVHLVGLALKRRFPRLPWIAHFSDPWVDNPFVKYDPLRRAYDRHHERAVYAAADVLSLTSRETIDLVFAGVRARYRDRTVEVPHAYDPALYPAAQPGTAGKLVLRSLGAFYGARSPEPLFRGLAILRERAPDAFERIVVELIGSVPAHFLDSTAFKSLPPQTVRALPAIDYCASLKAMRESDGLLAVDAPFANSPFLPSKLVDYIGAGRPVIGVTPPGAAARIIRELGGWVADPARPESVAECLACAIPVMEACRGHVWGAPAVRARYSADVVGAQFGALIERSIAKAGQPMRRMPCAVLPG